MDRLKLMKMSMNRFRLLLFSTLVASLMAISAGIAWADQATDAAQKAQGKVWARPKPTEAEAAKARAMRDDAVKRRHAAQDYIKKVTQGQQGQTTTPTPPNAGKGGEK